MKVYIAMHSYEDEQVVQGVFSKEDDAYAFLRQEGFNVPGPRERFLCIHGFEELIPHQLKYNMAKYNWSGCGEMWIEEHEVITPEIREEILDSFNDFAMEINLLFDVSVGIRDEIATLTIIAYTDTYKVDLVEKIENYYRNHALCKKYGQLILFIYTAEDKITNKDFQRLLIKC